MFTSKKIENLIGFIFIIGILISVSLVIMGGLIYLIHHGSDVMQASLIMPVIEAPASILQDIFTFTPIHMINLGLLALVLIQILRVGLLAWFYYSIKDKWFTFISSYILVILLYGLFWRK